MKEIEKLGIGDIIICKGIKVEIAKVVDNDGYCVEFYDTSGKYRNWKPEVDGGTCEIVGSAKSIEAKNKVCSKVSTMNKFYDTHTGRFIIPFEEVDYDISRCILLLIEKGWVLSAYENSGNKYYVVYSLVIDSEGWKPINSCYEELEFLEKILKKKGYSYIMEISLKEYLEDTKYQDLMDYVLFNNRVPNNDISIGVVIKNKSFKFIAVWEACY